MRDFELLRHSGFAAAIRKNVVVEPRWRSRINNSFLAWAMAQPMQAPALSEIANKPLYERPERNPATIQAWETASELFTFPNAGPWIVELARYSVQDGWIGIVKACEQVVIHPDVATSVIASGSPNWGNPFLISPSADIVWHWRVEKCDTGLGEPAFINASSLTPEILLPGEPHPEIPEQHDLWLPAGSASANNVHVTIGGRYRLRLLAIVRAPGYALQIACKLRGFEISAYSHYGLLASRSIW